FVGGSSLQRLRCHRIALISKPYSRPTPNDTPNFVDNWILGHKLFRHEFFRRAGHRAVPPLLSADQTERSGIRAIRAARTPPSGAFLGSMPQPLRSAALSLAAKITH